MHHWTSRSVEGLRPRATYPAFYIGSLVHKVLERWLMWDGKFVTGSTDHQRIQSDIEYAYAVIDEYCATEFEWKYTPDHPLYEGELQTFNDGRALARQMMEHFMRWEHAQKGPLALRNLRIIATEQPFAVPIFTETGRVYPYAYFAGTIDGIAERQDTGKLVILEHKTTKAVGQRTGTLWNEFQTSAYLNVAAQMFGADMIDGALYTIMRKAYPNQPTVLKSGLLSQAVAQQTLQSYMQYICEHHGITPDAPDYGYYLSLYGGAIVDLISQENSYFHRALVQRTERALWLNSRELYSIARHMVFELAEIEEGSDIPVRTTGDHCKFCMVKDLCALYQDEPDPAEFELWKADLYYRSGEQDAITVGDRD